MVVCTGDLRDLNLHAMLFVRKEKIGGNVFDAIAFDEAFRYLTYTSNIVLIEIIRLS